MPRPRLTTMAIGVIACAGLSACGAGGGATTTLAPAQFRARADGICRQSSQRFEQIQRTATTTPDEAERQIAALIDVSRQAADELRTLDPPGALAKPYADYLDARDRGIDFLQEGSDAASQRDASAYLKAKRRAASEERVRRRLARRLGLKACARSTAGARTGARG